MNTPGYESLANVLQRAYCQAANGKGAERHACHRPFTEQPMQTISELLQSPVGLLYQAMKKIQESQRLDKDAGVRELLGAINYLAGAVIFLEDDREAAPAGLPLMSRFDAPEEPARGKVNPIHHPAPGTWRCDHGTPNVRAPEEVTVGDACPVCFATKR